MSESAYQAYNEQKPARLLFLCDHASNAVPSDLDLLGLQIHLSQVELTIVAEPGPGNLLGNLLCAIAGLLDGPSTDALAARLNRLLAAL